MVIPRRSAVAGLVALAFIVIFAWQRRLSDVDRFPPAVHARPHPPSPPPPQTQTQTQTQTQPQTQPQPGQSQPSAAPTAAAVAKDAADKHDAFEVKGWKKPEGLRKIMGLVFYGRRHSVSILDCYLKRNLVTNGGMLDGVIFVERTKDAADLELLRNMMQSEPLYEKWSINMTADNFKTGFGNSYDLIEDDVLYVKMDDDIVYMDDSAISNIVKKKVEHPEYYTVSANVVNQPLLSWVHWNMGAIKPYLPETDETGASKSFKRPKTSDLDWRASKLPEWKGPDNFSLDKWEPHPEEQHRWLRLKRQGDHILDKTPIEETEYAAYGRGWTQWKIGAQEHYSFLENLENDDLTKYRFEQWDFQYARMGIQFIAIMGKDINQAKPVPSDDEQHFSVTMPKRTGRHAVASGMGIAVHYSFGSQRGGMSRTDILDRYRDYANKKVCAGDMLWSPDKESKSS